MKNLIEFCKGLGGAAAPDSCLELHTKDELYAILEDATGLVNRLLLGGALKTEGDGEKISADAGGTMKYTIEELGNFGRIPTTTDVPKSDAITISAAMLKALIVDAIEGVQQWRYSELCLDHVRDDLDGGWMETTDVIRLPDVIMEKVMEEVK
jgi:hypothetical protein